MLLAVGHAPCTLFLAENHGTNGAERTSNSGVGKCATVSGTSGPRQAIRWLVFVLEIRSFAVDVSRHSSLNHQTNNATAE